MPKGIPLTEDEAAKRRHEIFHKVANVFMKQGFHETSIHEIAKAAGLGKSILYDYFKTKVRPLPWMAVQGWRNCY